MKMKIVFLFVFSALGACRQAPKADAGPFIIKAPDAGIPKDFQWVYYDYGGPPEPYFSKAQAAVWKRYNVEATGFGCEVTEVLLHQIEVHNDSLFALLQPRYPGLNEDRILSEMQTYVTTQKSIEGIVAPYVKRYMANEKIKNAYPNTNWQPLDGAGREYGVQTTFQDIETGRLTGNRVELKVNPATGDYLVQNAAGNWVEQ